jgi:hypothetical protein
MSITQSLQSGNQHTMMISMNTDQSSEEVSSRELKHVRRLEKPHTFQLKSWATLIIAVIIVLVILIAGTYAFNWDWTGFSGNKLWDWLELLVLPGVLTSLSIWFTVDQGLVGNKKEQRRWGVLWMVLITIALVVLIVLIIGGYALNWDWTGFSDNKLSDWLRLLFVPFVLPLVTVWFTAHPIEPGSAVNLQQADTQEVQLGEKMSG